MCVAATHASPTDAYQLEIADALFQCINDLLLPLDDAPGLDLMTSADGEVLDVQRELMAAAGTEVASTRFVERFAYYGVAKEAYLLVRTGETRKYGNALLRKGVVGHPSA